MSIVAALVLVVLLFLTVPIAHALLLACGVAMVSKEPLFLFEAILNLYQPTSSFPMLAIPFFILAGDLMMSGRLGEYLVLLAKTLVGGLRGGMAQVSVVGSLFFGGVSGSAVADASAIGNALIPVQKRQGYPPGYAAAVNAASSTISVLIPPSIPLILYGLVTETSIPRLFLAGIVPGVALTILLFALCHVIGMSRRLPASPPDAKERFPFYKAVPALLMPVMIVLLARGGVATPTEISVFAVAYALLVGGVVYRDLTLAIILRSVLTSGMMTGIIMLVIMGSSVLQWILSFESVPENLALLILDVLESPWAIIIGMNLLMIIVGTFLDLPAAVLLLAPIFLGVAAQIGMDPIQLGVMMVVNLAIGLYTPPVGTTLFVSVAIERVGIWQVARHLLPFYIVALIILGLVGFVPEFTLIFT